MVEWIKLWAREIGARRLVFGLIAVAAVYLDFGLMLAGHHADEMLLSALWILACVSGMVAGWKVMPMSKAASRVGALHCTGATYVLFALWAFPREGIGRPQSPDDFRILMFAIMALFWATMALAKQGPRDTWA